MEGGDERVLALRVEDLHRHGRATRIAQDDVQRARMASVARPEDLLQYLLVTVLHDKVEEVVTDQARDGLLEEQRRKLVRRRLHLA
eukprot:1039684-Heterocapsa_arctica.AAC.1